MRFLPALAVTIALLLLAVPAAEAAWPTKLGVIVSTQGAPKNNSSTASSFSLPEGSAIIIQCDKDTRAVWGTTSSVAASSTDGMVILANRAVIDDVAKDQTGSWLKYLGTYPINSGETSTCYVARYFGSKR